MSISDDLLLDEDLLKPPKKKKANSCQKGKRFERSLGKLLTERFGEEFTRTIGSGNRWGQVNHLPKHAQETFTGDLVTPAGFKFCIESKAGYEDIDLHACFLKGNAQLDEFMKQAVAEGKRANKKPLILWKKMRKPWLALLKTNDLPRKTWKYRFIYKDWSIVPLEELLKLEDDFFIEVNK